MEQLNLKRKITLKDLRPETFLKKKKRVPNVLVGEISHFTYEDGEKKLKKIPPALAKLKAGSVVYSPNPEEKDYPYIYIQLSEKPIAERYSVRKDLFF